MNVQFQSWLGFSCFVDQTSAFPTIESRIYLGHSSLPLEVEAKHSRSCSRVRHTWFLWWTFYDLVRVVSKDIACDMLVLSEDRYRVLRFPFPGGLSLSFRLLNGYRLVWTSDSEQVFVLIGSHWFSYGCRSLVTDTFSWFDDGCILTLFTSNTEYEKLLFVVRSITWCHSNSVWTETGGRFTQENHSGLCWVHICCNGLDHWWNGT